MKRSINLLIIVICTLSFCNFLHAQTIPVPFKLVTPSGASSIQWHADIGNGFNPIIGETNDTLKTNEPGIYYADFLLENCENSTGYFVFLYNPHSLLSLPATFNLAEGASNIQWYDNSDALGGENAEEFTTNDPGEYYVEAWYEHCFNESPHLFLVNPIPPEAIDDIYNIERGITLSDQNVMINDGPSTDNLYVELLDSVSHGSLSFNSDGTFVYMPDINFALTDTFTYTLVNAHGLKDTATVYVEISCSGLQEDELFIPQLVTPNGDEINDEWKIIDLKYLMKCYDYNEVYIFNRWEHLIYYTKDYGVNDNWWNGYAQEGEIFKEGDLIPPGTYYYIIVIDGDKKNALNGFIHVHW